jgi:hypothetical protein
MLRNVDVVDVNVDVFDVVGVDVAVVVYLHFSGFV